MPGCLPTHAFGLRCAIGIGLVLTALAPRLTGQTNLSEATTNWWADWLKADSSATNRGFVVEKSEGRVYQFQKGTRSEITKSRQPLNEGDRLETQTASRALVLGIMQASAVDQSTRLEVVDPWTLKINAGKVYFKSLGTPGPTEQSNVFLVKTPAGDFSPQGTEFQLTVDPSGERSTITSFDGEVVVSNSFGIQTNRFLEMTEVGFTTQPRNPTPIEAVQINNLIQWALYYPAVINPDELDWGDGGSPPALTNSLSAYRFGNLRQALEFYPTDRLELEGAEKIYRAALLLSVGRVDEVTELLAEWTDAGTTATANTNFRLARALRQLVAAVKFQEFPATTPELASEWLAESYYQQSRTSPTNLLAARAAARRTTNAAPEFSFAYARLAELEFGFGQTKAAQRHIDEALRLAPHHAQAMALRGFLRAAENKIDQAITNFQQAIYLDRGLGNAWLGLGLCHFHEGRTREGLRFVQIATTAEPQRALLRSYLGKAYHEAGLTKRAAHELKLAQQKGETDPTSWLYSALLKRQQNRINEAVRDLEHSRDLNDNRSLYRSRLMLDQDDAVRRVSLAKIYRDAGMADVSLREATRAVQSDYANAAAHQFLAQSYDAFNDLRATTLRYETPWANELFLANLLSPVGGSALSQSVSQHEYSRLFDRDHFGIFSLTDYRGDGDFSQLASQFGKIGHTAYALDVSYFRQNGQRANQDRDLRQAWLTVQQEITPQDSVLGQVIYKDDEFGDLSQQYWQTNASRSFRAQEKQEPIAVLGYHRQWNPQNHTLLLAALLNDTVSKSDASAPQALIKTPAGNVISNFFPSGFEADLRARESLDIYSAELQHIWQREDAKWSTMVGGRYQFGDFTTHSTISNPTNQQFLPPILYDPTRPLADQRIKSEFRRGVAYAYQNWRVVSPLLLTAGVTYDTVHYPINAHSAPVSATEDTKSQFSPKAGFIWTPGKRTSVRGAYTRSLGGVSFDQSFRLEPNQVAGFIQSYRSLVPEAVAGSVAAEKFETWGLSVDHRFGRNTYVGLAAEVLQSRGDQFPGAFTANALVPIKPGGYEQRRDFREQSLLATLNQLLSDEWSIGARYRFSRDELATAYPGLPVPSSDESSTLHQLNLNVLYHHPCGLFAQAEGIWFRQENRGYQEPRPGDNFWQANLFVGYRLLQRRVEVRAGVLNVTDQDYHLNPLNFYSEPPRERTFFASLKLNF